MSEKCLSRSLSLLLDLEGRTTIESHGHILLSEAPNITIGNQEVTESKKVEIQSIIHKHPSWNDDDDENKIVCGDCSKRVPDDSISIYSCIPCNHSSHKSCGELPQKIRHSLHPQHLLHLFVSSPGYYDCDLCQETIQQIKYNCTLCDFDLHIRCALSNTFEKPQDHDKHSFVFLKPTFFTCDGCGVDEIEKKCISCVCTTCQLQVHQKCSYSFPLAVKFGGHSHKLHLSYSFQIDFDYAKMFCKICFKKMNTVFCMYLCTDCTYIAHASCVFSRFKSEDRNTHDDPLEIEKEDFTKEKEIKHFSHPHCLLYQSDDESKIDAICNGCTRPISADSFYTCGDDQCQRNFFLHKQCFQLPKMIYHPQTMLPTTSTNNSVTLSCYRIIRIPSDATLATFIVMGLYTHVRIVIFTWTSDVVYFHMILTMKVTNAVSLLLILKKQQSVVHVTQNAQAISCVKDATSRST